MSKADLLHTFRRISTDEAVAAEVAAADLSHLGEIDLDPAEHQMLIGAASELCEAADDVVGSTGPITQQEVPTTMPLLDKSRT